MGAPADEARLVERARRGERAGFDGLVRLHFRRVFALAFRLEGNPEDAEDLAQETFVRAHGALRHFRGGSFAGFLHRIAVHLARDRARARARRPRAVAPAGEPAARQAGPGEALSERERLRALRQELERLPENLRVPLVLRALEGLAYEEVAEATGVTPATARTQVARARRELARRLGRVLGEARR